MRCALLLCLGVIALAGCASRSQQYCGEQIEPRDATPRHVTVLGDDLAPLRDVFNAQSERWRTVALVSPTCSECVLGAEVVEKEITARYAASQVAAMIVWIPMLPTDNELAARGSATIFPPPPNERVTQFYDAQQTLGTRYAQQTFAGLYERARKSLTDDHWLATALDDRIEQKRPQWDLYMLYAPGVRWEESNDAPPMPTHWIRHLGRRGDASSSTSTYWQDTPESGPREGDLYEAIRAMADQAIGKPLAIESPAMNIEVLGFEGCPNTPRTKANVEKAAASLGLAAKVVYVDQMILPESDRRRAWPAPTVLVNGRDLFGMSAPPADSAAMGCRLYTGGAPGEREIADALKSFSGN